MSKKSDIKLLAEIEDELFSEMCSFNTYAGTAFLTNDEENMHFFKGQYRALDRARKKIEERRLGLLRAKG